jgi:hypothetical protein
MIDCLLVHASLTRQHRPFICCFPPAPVFCFRLLDVVLFTRALSRVMGYKRQAALYGYFAVTSQLLRLTAPPLALMTAQETALGGAFRAAHQRLVANAEEVAVRVEG